MKRDRAGKRYFVNYPKIEETLTDEAIVEGKAITSTIMEEQRLRVEEKNRAADQATADYHRLCMSFQLAAPIVMFEVILSMSRGAIASGECPRPPAVGAGTARGLPRCA